jgi:hypothetical protein
MRTTVALVCLAVLAAGCFGSTGRAAPTQPAGHTEFRLLFSPATGTLSGDLVGPPAASRSVRCPGPLCRTILAYLHHRPHGSRACVGTGLIPAEIVIVGRISGRPVSAVVRPQCTSGEWPAITRMVATIYAAATGRPQLTVATTSR